MDKKKETGMLIKTMRKSRGWTQAELAKYAGCSTSTIAMYEIGKREPDFETLEALADTFNVPMVALVPNGSNGASHKIPLLGVIACGIPILANENIEDYIDIPLFVNADFALRCKGDSMIGARIMDGDIVCIRTQADVDDGQIAAVYIDGEATLKRVRHLQGGGVLLLADNPNYHPILLGGTNEDEDAHVIGKATYFISKVI